MTVSSIFNDFILMVAKECRIQDKNLYCQKREPHQRHCINPFLATESDLEMAFGAFLQSRLKDKPLSVHSQMRIYRNGSRKGIADLTIHRTEPDSAWMTDDDVQRSLIAVIEVKYANFGNPNYDFKRGCVEKDLKNLASLGKGISRYLLILDEAGHISEGIEETTALAKREGIAILSNNESLACVSHILPENILDLC
jgi:hypothetical protein